MNQNLTIKNDTLLEEFLQHLQITDNNDIILSAPFGTGKTYFLKEDFTPKTENQYNVIHLFPVNYSVASNEDIFELIKYDILFEIMLKFNDQLTKSEDIQIGKSLAIQGYLQNEFKVVDFFLQMLKTSGKIGKSITQFIDLLKQEKGKFEEFSKNLEANEYDVIKGYLESFESGEGAKEFDAISALIRDVLVKMKGDDKQNILIIDDLDRIDPEHIFRIFNVLSAHRDYQTQNNKFGFDKVVLVCDIENIRRIYQHRYGPLVDFQGYINKFYSKTIFQFDNIRFINEVLDKYLAELKYPDFGKSYTHFNLATHQREGFYLVVRAFLQFFLGYKLLSLRSLKNIDELMIRNKAFIASKNNRERHSTFDYDFLVLLEYLSVFFGSKSILKGAIQGLVGTKHFAHDLSTFGVDIYDYDLIARNLLEMAINIIEMDNIIEGDRDKRYEFAPFNGSLKVEYEIERYGFRKYAFLPDNQDFTTGLDLLQLFKETFDIVDHRRYLS